MECGLSGLHFLFLFEEYFNIRIVIQSETQCSVESRLCL